METISGIVLTVCCCRWSVPFTPPPRHKTRIESPAEAGPNAYNTRMDEKPRNQSNQMPLRFVIAGIVAGFAFLCAYNLLLGATTRFRTQLIENDNVTLFLLLGTDLLLFRRRIGNRNSAWTVTAKRYASGGEAVRHGLPATRIDSSPSMFCFISGTT
jgi:hypothetical protein